MNSLREDRLNLEASMRFYADVAVLDTLCSNTALARLENEVETLNYRDKMNFLRGYRLAVATPLHGILRFAINYPNLLDMKEDQRLFNWLHFHSSNPDEALWHAVSDSKSDLARLCYVFNGIWTDLRRAEGGLGSTVIAIKKLQETVTTFKGILSGASFISLKTGEELTDRDSILRLVVAEQMLDYVEYDRIDMLGAYSIVWGRKEELQAIWAEEFVLRAETPLAGVPMFPTGSGVPGQWYPGLCFGFDSVIQLNGIELPSHSISAEFNAPDWFNELKCFVNQSNTPGEWPSSNYGLKGLSMSKIREMVAGVEVNINEILPKQRFAAVLGSESMRLMSDSNVTDMIELELMLRGAIEMFGDSKVRILLLTHSVDSDDREWVSLAFRLPVYGNVLGSNSSKWFLFYKIYHEGFVTDSDVARARRSLERLMLQLKDHLEVEIIIDLDFEDILSRCELDAFREMSILSRNAVETNATLRSASSELLAAFWLMIKGYKCVKVAFRQRSLGQFEYDAIGVKDGKCLVIEVKSASTTGKELETQINRLEAKVRHLEDRLPDLKIALGCDYEIENVSGLFVSLGDLDDFSISGSSIRLWGYDDFVRELKAVGLPNRIMELLDKSQIIRAIEYDGFDEDSSFFGLQSLLGFDR